MRSFMTLVEGLHPLYHGSHTLFPLGTILTPQAEGYVSRGSDDPMTDPAHHMCERLLEKYRPEGCVARNEAVFLVSDPDDIDNAGGYSDHIYEVEPSSLVTKCNLHWYSELYLLCEHETASQAEAKAQGRDWYPDWEEAEAREYADKYWTAVSSGTTSDLYEFLTPSAKVISIVE
jgi:hypothetical protein